MRLFYARQIWFSLPLLIAFLSAGPAQAQTSNLVITGIIDGPLTGGVPKAIELYVTDDIADLSAYGLERVSNGGGSTGAPSYSFPAVPAAAGDYLYASSEADGFLQFFGFASDFPGAPIFVNGDDAMVLYLNGTAVDVVGDPDVDGTGMAWEYTDGWAYRMDGTGPSASFDAAEFMYSGIDALDGEATNATAQTPFPIGTYSATTGGGGGGMIVVTTPLDVIAADGLCSLREAVQAANTNRAVSGCAAGSEDGDTITFAATATAITLSLGELTVTDDVTIDGSLGAGARVIIDAGGTSRIFDVDAASGPGAVQRVNFTALMLQNGHSGMGGSSAPDAGGAVDLKAGSRSTFTDVDVTGSVAGINGGGIHGAGNTDIVITTSDTGASLIADNEAQGAESNRGGGGVWGAGIVMISGNVIVTGNRATGAAGSGGGVFNLGGTLTVQGATISDNTANRAGGGIESAGGTVVLTNVTLIRNDAGTAPGNGGGVHIGGNGRINSRGGTISGNTAVEGGGYWVSGAGTMTVSGGTFSGNVASGDAAEQGGGGLYNDGGTLVIAGATIDGNMATGAAGSGGGILNNGGTLTVQNATVSNNTANRAGGGIEDAGGANTMIRGVTLSGNDAGMAPGNGGGFHAGGAAMVTVSGGSATGNTAVEGGGYWISGAGTLVVDGVRVEGNTASGADADQGGGGLYSDGGTLTVRNSTVTENTATGASGSGGGILAKGGTLTVMTARITSNTANRAGGGIEVNGSGGATVSITDAWLVSNDAGTAPGNGGGFHAGGAAEMTFSNVRFMENTAVEGAGFWINAGGMLTASDLDVFGNVASGAAADQGGGGFYNDGGEATIMDSFFRDNVASGTSGSGGGILNNSGMLTVTDTRFFRNSANRAGGAIEDVSAAGDMGQMLSMTSVTMEANDAGANPGNGGGLHITGPGMVRMDSSMVDRNMAGNEGGGLWNSGVGSLDVTYTTVRGNTAVDGGGLYQQAGETGLLQFMNSTASENVASGNGGGALADGGAIQITNSTISRNQAGSGAGVASNGGRILLSSATVAQNEATTSGGGLANLTSDMEDAVSPDNTIVGGNVAPTGANLFGAIMSRGYNLFQTTDGGDVSMDDSAGAANDDLTGVNPRLGPLADNGGPTRTHAIAENSPAVNAGWTALTIDQRGVERVATPDIGAFESNAAPTAGEESVTEFADGEMAKMSPLAPNPFSGTATTTMAVRQAQTVRVALYDVMGREVRVLHDGPVAAATSLDLRVDAAGLASGVYVIVVRGESVQMTQRITVAR